MIVNESKTEVTVFSKTPEPTIMDIDCSGKVISTKPTMKALGVLIDHRLRWSDHIKNVCTRVRRLLCGMRMIRHKFTEVQANILITAQVLSILYYGAPAWLTPHLLRPDLRRIESVHYKCLRLIVKDYRQRISREWIDAATQRLPPKLLGKFATASLAIKIRQAKAPLGLYEEIFKNTYAETRKPGRLFGFDSSRVSVGRSMTKNWIGQTLGHIKTAWTESHLSNDQIRRLLKRTCYLLLISMCIFGPIIQCWIYLAFSNVLLLGFNI